jgi:uncharacterized protein (DUF2267 family)
MKMRDSTLEVFDSTVQKTRAWLSDVMISLELKNRQEAYHALRSVLHALRARLTINEVAQLGAQMPLLLRGIYYDEWNPSRASRDRSREGFLSEVMSNFGVRPFVDAETMTRGVFRVLSRNVSEGEVRQVKALLPSAIRKLWPD